MIHCPHCSSRVSDEARFCSACGQPTSAASVTDFAATVAASTPYAHRIATSVPQEAGFAPGQVIAGRYRIVGLLGRGGMGEVYRADDLKLGTVVALKFLSQAAEQDAGLIERFLAEVRTARQVSHPHVCRVYDIGEVDGRHFLSMEYVDGEDLATLLRRIGRLPPAKAIEIARQIAAGLAAAHEKGVLHRDLKPANVMIDGHGRARITDFGLAVLAGEASAEVAGTPAYMAPEQLAGLPATEQTDVYALGLVFYELFTGEKPFAAESVAEWKQAHATALPTSPSLHTTDMDPVVERVILRCLEKDPAFRPRSAAQVALALPGGDPLAAALAAGETPSPEMVAAAGGEGALAPRRAWAALAAFAVLLVVVMMLVPASTDLGLAPMERSPDALRDRAHEIAHDFGYVEPPIDETTWLQRDYQPLRWLADHVTSTAWRRRLPAIGSPVLLNYRSSTRPLVPAGLRGRVTLTDPPADLPGEIRIVIDANGRLREWRAMPARWSNSDSVVSAFPEDVVFREAGLDRTRFTPVAPEWVPSVSFDTRREWTGTRAEAPEMGLRFGAATFRGRLVSAAVLGPWAARDAKDSLAASVSQRISSAALAVFTVLIFVASAVFARRNIRLGRGDRRGAFRVAFAAFLLDLTGWAVSVHPARDWNRLVLDQFIPAVGAAAFFGGGLAWMIYMALEPYLRRRMPNLLVGWVRMLDGRWRDPHVGRDVLLGLVLGTFIAVVYHLVNGLPTWIPFTAQTTIGHFGLRTEARMVPLGTPIFATSDAFLRTLGELMLLFGIRIFTSRTWIAALILTILFTTFFLGGENPALETPSALIFGLVIALTMIRLGPLAVGVMWFANVILTNAPVRVSLSLWYAPYMFATLVLLIGLALWSFRTSLGGRPAFGSVSLDS
jgi:serine/threonine-protein kinase